MTIGHFKPCWESAGTVSPQTGPGGQALRNLSNLAFSGHQIEDKTTLTERILICWLYSRKNNYEDTFVKFSNFISLGGFLTPCFVPREWFLYTVIVPRGGFLLPSSRVPGVCPGRDGFG